MFIYHDGVRVNMDLVSFYSTQDREKEIVFFGQRSQNQGGYPVIHTFEFKDKDTRDKAINRIDNMVQMKTIT